ncbi:MAG: radical SAM family heme chaperone HemW [Phototrophicaceae bacterium]
MDTQTLSLYLHIPFCRTMCTYCAFNTYTGMEDTIPAFVDALVAEINYAGKNNPDLPVDTIFFGGGTPSLITILQYEYLFSTLRDSFEILPTAEITLESNPNDLSYDYLQGLRTVGFNRISMGMQSSNAQELALFKREHSTQQVITAVKDAQSVGFDNISIDLIFGTPNQTLETWRETLQQVIELNIQNISAYNLILEGNTSLKDDIDKGILPTPDDDLAADMYDLMTDMLEQAHFEQYEISNWSKAGYESRHNIQYWRNLPYLGLGPGAHGFANQVRYIVMRSPQKYIDALSSIDDDSLGFPRTPAVSKAVEVARDDDIQETILMGMRLTQEGISRQVFKERFGQDIVEMNQEAVDKHVDYGLLEVTDDRIRLSKAGRLLSNAVIRDLI